MTLKFLLSLALISFLGEVNYTPNGKSYKALINESCKEMHEGGCMLYTYRMMHFEEDSVTISHELIVHCSPEKFNNNYGDIYKNLSSTYKWRIDGDSLKIEGLKDLKQLYIQNSELIGLHPYSKKKITFKEEM